MKLLLSAQGLDLDEYYTISTFSKFVDMPDEEFSLIQEIRIDDYLLGLNCIMNLADRPRKILDRINFVLNVLEPEGVRELQYYLRKYRRVYQKELDFKKERRFHYVNRKGC